MLPQHEYRYYMNQMDSYYTMEFTIDVQHSVDGGDPYADTVPYRVFFPDMSGGELVPPPSNASETFEWNGTSFNILQAFKEALEAKGVGTVSVKKHITPTEPAPQDVTFS